MVFLFARHSDKPLKSLISMAHEGNHICLHRFSFIYAVNDLCENAYTCPINVMNRATKSAIYVMELTVIFGFCRSYSGLTDFHNWDIACCTVLAQ